MWKKLNVLQRFCHHKEKGLMVLHTRQQFVGVLKNFVIFYSSMQFNVGSNLSMQRMRERGLSCVMREDRGCPWVIHCRVH